MHERVGRLLDLRRLDHRLTELGAQEFGGLLLWGGVGLVLGALIVACHRTSSLAARSASWRMFALSLPFMAIATSYVMVSVLHPELLEAARGVGIASARIVVKLLTMTLIFVYALLLFRDGISPEKSLHHHGWV